MGKVFISYRREDSAGWAGRLCDRLSLKLGADQVFMDVQDIRPGENFEAAIGQRISDCDVVLAVIGPRWLTGIQNRADKQEDFVRHEIEVALRRGIPLIPLLVGGAPMPRLHELPENLGALSRRQALVLGDESFEEDFSRLTEAAGSLFKPTRHGTAALGRPRFWLFAAPVLVLIGILASILVTREEVQNIDGRWTAVLQKEGQPPFTISLNLTVIDDTLAGVVDYPTGSGAIQDGRLQGRKFSFYTKHIPQFANEAAIIRCTGGILGEEIQLTLISDDGIAKGVAKRTAQK